MRNRQTDKARLSAIDLEPINDVLEQKTPEEIIAWASGVFGRSLGLMTSLQKGGSMLLDLVLKTIPEPTLPTLDVVFVNTGVYDKTITDYAQTLGEMPRVNLRELKPNVSWETQLSQEGRLHEDRDQYKTCCALRKKEPLKQIAGQYDGLFSSLRRADGGVRGKAKVLVLDPAIGAIKIHPLVNVTNDVVDAYLEKHDVPVNPWFAEGYSAVNCMPCIRKALPDDIFARDSKWPQFENGHQLACGINPSDARVFAISMLVKTELAKRLQSSI